LLFVYSFYCSLWIISICYNLFYGVINYDNIRNTSIFGYLFIISTLEQCYRFSNLYIIWEYISNADLLQIYKWHIHIVITTRRLVFQLWYNVTYFIFCYKKMNLHRIISISPRKLLIFYQHNFDVFDQNCIFNVHEVIHEDIRPLLKMTPLMVKLSRCFLSFYSYSFIRWHLLCILRYHSNLL